MLSCFIVSSLYTVLLVRIISGNTEPSADVILRATKSLAGQCLLTEETFALGSALRVPALLPLKVLERVCCLLKDKEECWGE